MVIRLFGRLNVPKNGGWYPSFSYTGSAIGDTVCGKHWEAANHNTTMRTQVLSDMGKCSHAKFHNVELCPILAVDDFTNNQKMAKGINANITHQRIVEL